MVKKYKKCFHCGSKLETRNGGNYCTHPTTGASVSMFDIRGCYYTWNTDPRNGGHFRTSDEILASIKKETSNP